MKRNLLCAIAVIVAAALAAPAAAQFASPLHIIPVIAKLKGDQGTDWRSDGAITNVTSAIVTVRMQFFREATSNSFNGSFSA